MSYGAGTTRFATEVCHPNVSTIGEINLDILGTKWTPDYDVAAVLKSLHALLPNPDLTRPANLDATLQFRKNPGFCLL
ncbi:ubiquitin-conjugating enzyme E2 [Streptomyces sp. NPDC005480]|uniref:ubiquitin-conjugating enzyme E2 n=1 Tax=Streptomyces sp. NPDC005480 TaxID=3154880 RepID=UPI0033A4E9F5